jgi:hypothetical protein
VEYHDKRCFYEVTSEQTTDLKSSTAIAPNIGTCYKIKFSNDNSVTNCLQSYWLKHKDYVKANNMQLLLSSSRPNWSVVGTKPDPNWSVVGTKQDSFCSFYESYSSGLIFKIEFVILSFQKFILLFNMCHLYLINRNHFPAKEIKIKTPKCCSLQSVT